MPLVDDFSKLPVLLQYAMMVGTAIVIIVLGLRKRQEAPAPPAQVPFDRFQFTMATIDRLERDIGSHFDRVDRCLVDINKDTTDIRRGVSELLERERNR